MYTQENPSYHEQPDYFSSESYINDSSISFVRGKSWAEAYLLLEDKNGPDVNTQIYT